METRPFADRNFAGGEARERYERYREHGLEVPGSRVLEAVSTVGSARSRSRSSPPADSAESPDD
ncbi:ABC transporter-related protein [Natrinema thermotolerans DSM 11552]|nr:ABC transporter-related protein [Natrinema thermotolerans DSM 11552]